MEEYNLQAAQRERAVLGMGCFWGPDSLFGSLPGVISTQVGFAGGTTADPTYRRMGDHTETVEILFDPERISYEDLMRTFWRSHDAVKDRTYKERQYISLLIYDTEAQRETAERVRTEEEARSGRPIQTEFQPFHAFYPAEEHHQKYNLKRFKRATETARSLFPTLEEFHSSTIAARLNGFVREYGSLDAIKAEIRTWGLNEQQLEELQEMLAAIKW